MAKAGKWAISLAYMSNQDNPSWVKSTSDFVLKAVQSLWLISYDYTLGEIIVSSAEESLVGDFKHAVSVKTILLIIM